MGNIDLNLISGTGGPTFEPITTGQETQMGGVTKDQMEKSAQQLVLLFLSSMYPQLVPPNYSSDPNFDPKVFMKVLEDTQQKAISFLLDRWQQDNKEIAQANLQKEKLDNIIKIEIERDRIISVLQIVAPTALAGIQGTTPSGTQSVPGALNLTGIAQVNTTTEAGQVDPKTGSVIPDLTRVGISTGILLSTIAALGYGTGALSVSNASFDSINGVTRSVFESVPLTTSVDLSGAYQLMAALFGASIYYGAIRGAVSEAGGGQTQDLTLAFARQFLEDTAKFVQSPGFTYFVLATLPGGLDEAAKLSDGDRNKLVSLAKLSYLLTALSVATRAETGGGMGDEVWALATGNTKLPDNDPRAPVIALVKEVLKEFSPSELAALQSGFGGYLSSSTPVDKLLDPINLLKAWGDNQNFNNSALIQAPVDR